MIQIIWEQILENKDAYVKAALATIPEDIKKYGKNHIFDEDKSVKWNREEVEKRNAVYENKRLELQDKRLSSFDTFYQSIIIYVQEELSVSQKKAKKIVEYCWQEKHSYGVNDFLIMVEELIDVFMD